MARYRRIAGLIVLGTFLASAALWAQLPGTLFGQVFDEKEKPIEGVTITLTDPENPNFKQEETTDKRGRYKIFVANATVPYAFKFSKEGYQTLNLRRVKIPARGTTRQDFTLVSLEKALAAQKEAGVPTATEEAPTKGGGPIAVYNQGVKALDAGDLATAEAKFLEAIEKKPDLASAHAALARLRFEQKQYTEAVAAAEKSLALEAENPDMHQILYAAYIELGEKEKADEALGKLQTSDPGKASKNLFNRAADLYNAGQVAEARPLFEQILAADPSHAKSHYMLGLCLVNTGDSEKAKEHFNKFLELAPDDPDAATAREMINYL